MKILRAVTIAGLMISLIILGKEAAFGSELVKVAILDSGSNIDYKEGISLIDGTVKDYNGHGTLMASIVKEAYPEAELYVIKVIGKDGLAVNEDAIILGLEWAISRDVDVINMSLRLKNSERLYEMIKKAQDRGIVIVAAAGNKSTKMGLPHPCVQERGLLTQEGAISLTEVAYPARYPEVIAVGALNRYGRIYEASIKGEEVDFYCKGYRGRKTGTSIASAYATGIIAETISENPHFSVEELKSFMRKQTQRSGGEIK